MILGGTLISIYPTSISLAYDRLERRNYVPAAGALLLFSSIGSMAGPLVASGLMDLMGPYGLFVHICAIAVLMLAFIAYRATQRPAVAGEERREFVTVAPTTQAGMELDPRLKRENGSGRD